ncbi:MAG: hypothetical protein PF574_05435 [Candidatus Delongbacteria bacterium]|jgi:hypothetical protein|nr:hypothetical protein [Candidatus Delongbacteria bacterium]
MKYIVIIIITITTIIFAQNDGLKLGGYLETKLSCMLTDDEVTTSNALFRLEGNYDIGDKGKVEAHLVYNYDLQPIDPFASFKDNSIYAKIMGDGLFTIADGLDSLQQSYYDMLMGLFADNTSTYLPYSSYYPKETMIMDRALVKLYFKNSDFIIGKQQIAWGTGYAFNPTDIWNIKDPMNATVGKVGVLALNLETYFGESTSLNVIASPGSDFDHWRYGFRVKSNTGRFDYSVLAIRDKTDDGEIMGFPEKLLLGSDFAGEIFAEIGWWGEVAVINPRYVGMEFSDTDSIYVQAVTGFDYTFDNEIYFMAEYYFNALGDNDYKDYDINSLGLTTGGAMSGFAQNYLATMLSYSFWDKYTASLLNITNLDDISSVLIPEVSYEFHPNIMLKLNSSIFMGSSSRTEYGGMYSSAMFSVVGYF